MRRVFEEGFTAGSAGDGQRPRRGGRPGRRSWLRRAFSDLRFDIHHIEVTGNRATAFVTLHGTHTGPFVVHESADGSVTGALPPTGRAFTSRQVHWFRIADGAIAEHDAVRDDLEMAKQSGWIPQTPGYIFRMRTARRRERKREHSTIGTAG